MTGYSAFHLTLFGFCLLMAAVLAAASLAFRSERSLPWVAVAFVGFGLLALGLAGSSLGSGDSLGPRGPWLLVAYFAGVPTFVGLLRSGWSLAHARMTRMRRVAELALAAMAFAAFLSVVWEVLRSSGRLPAYEDVLLGPGHAARVLSGSLVGVVVAWNLEGWLAVRRKNPIGWAMLIGGAIAIAFLVLTFRQILTGGPLRPTWLGATGVAYVLFAAGAAGARTFQVARLNREAALSGYRVLRHVASGGMGDLYLAVRVGPAGFQHLVAIKRIRDGGSSPGLVERFLAEGRIAARLSHPNIVDVHDIGRVAGGWFIAMEYIAGVSLRDLLRRSSKLGTPVPLSLALSCIEEASAGIAAAHAAGVVHRDIKPDNLMLSFEGVLKVVDFGIAKQLGAGEKLDPVAVAPPSPETRAGDLVGTLEYMAPERLRGEPASPSSDVYGLGAVLYELLSGARMTPRDVDPIAFVSGTWRPQPVSARRGDLPAGLAAAVDRATAHESSKRFGTAQVLAEALLPIREALTFTDPATFVRELFGQEWAEHRALVAGVLPEPVEAVEPAETTNPTTATVAARPRAGVSLDAETRTTRGSS